MYIYIYFFLGGGYSRSPYGPTDGIDLFQNKKKVEGYIKKIECDSKCLMLTATVTDTFRQKVPTNEVSYGPHVPDHSGMERRQ